MIGTFHLPMGYYKKLGKKMEGSGFGDILLESGIISSGSLQGVLSGKNYSRATRCHKVLNEAMHRLLMREFKLTNAGRQVFDALQSHKEACLQNNFDKLTREGMEELMNDDTVGLFTDRNIEFCDSVEKGALEKTPKFWILYMDHVALVLLLDR